MSETDTDKIDTLHNMDARTAKIQEVCTELDRMDEEIDILNEERRTYRKKHIKHGLDMKLGDFDAMRRIHGMKEERKNDYIDVLREGFSALGVEEQLDWITADARIQKRNEERKKAAEESEEAEEEAANSEPVGGAD